MGAARPGSGRTQKAPLGPVLSRTRGLPPSLSVSSLVPGRQAVCPCPGPTLDSQTRLLAGGLCPVRLRLSRSGQVPAAAAAGVQSPPTPWALPGPLSSPRSTLLGRKGASHPGWRLGLSEASPSPGHGRALSCYACFSEPNPLPPAAALPISSLSRAFPTASLHLLTPLASPAPADSAPDRSLVGPCPPAPALPSALRTPTMEAVPGAVAGPGREGAERRAGPRPPGPSQPPWDWTSSAAGGLCSFIFNRN